MNISSEKNSVINNDLMRLIVCPVTGGHIYYDQKKNLVISKSAKLCFPVRNGIPILIRAEAKPLVND